MADADLGRDEVEEKKGNRLQGLPLAQRNKNKMLQNSQNSSSKEKEWPVLKRTFSTAQTPYKQPMGLTNFP